MVGLNSDLSNTPPPACDELAFILLYIYSLAVSGYILSFFICIMIYPFSFLLIYFVFPISHASFYSIWSLCPDYTCIDIFFIMFSDIHFVLCVLTFRF